MLFKKETVQIQVKLFSGLDTTAGLTGYDPEKGIDMELPEGTRIKKVVRSLGLPSRDAMVVFLNGKQARLGDKIKNRDVLFCMKPVSGG